jgi:hypothetical protein
MALEESWETEASTTYVKRRQNGSEGASREYSLAVVESPGASCFRQDWRV